MKLIRSMVFVACTGFLVSCVTTAIPTELSNARRAYQHASEGPAAQLVPAELHKAKLALNQAEASFLKEPKSYQTKDLAYVAERKAIKAEALASIVSQKASTAQASKDYQATQGKIIEQTKSDLARTQMEKNDAATAAESDRLAVEEQARRDAAAAEAENKLAVAEQARLDAVKGEADARSELAKVVAINEESRGLVITLSGSVLFTSSQAVILPSAQLRLNQIAVALMSNQKYRRLTVEGHTDSRGSDAYNMTLSKQRAESVRTYLISRGYPAELIEARGIGEASPIADNKSSEGRSNNRRVEIIVLREAIQG